MKEQSYRGIIYAKQGGYAMLPIIIVTFNDIDMEAKNFSYISGYIWPLVPHD